jgi:hypothetical protein
VVTAGTCTVPALLQALTGSALYSTLKNTAEVFTGNWGSYWACL